MKIVICKLLHIRTKIPDFSGMVLVISCIFALQKSCNGFNAAGFSIYESGINELTMLELMR